MLNRSALHPYVRRPRAATPQSWWSVPALLTTYDWPIGLPGGGTIGIVELGGGYAASDLDAFFSSIGVLSPDVTDVSVDGTTNSPTPGADSPDVEVALDIEVAAAAYQAATGKRATVRVYWSQDIGAAIARCAADGCATCSISWGADEADWGTAAAVQLQDQILAAVRAGTMVFAAAGDNDSSDGGPGAANVDLPASAPNAIGCGGTSKPPGGGPETVWNNEPGKSNGSGTGGGFSTIFPTTLWKPGMPTRPGLGRMVPDVAACADPETGYRIYVHGAWTVVGGTSAVAPLYAGLAAACAKRHGVGYALWRNPSCFDDVTFGDNGAYAATVGPDPCTGLGTLRGKLLAEMLSR